MNTASKIYNGMHKNHSRKDLQKSKFAPKRTITLQSGEQVRFELMTLQGRDEISEKTVVDPDNIRDQAELTEDALSEIIDDIANGYQIFTALGYVDEQGKISVVDGSRRRMCALLRDSRFTIEVADRKISQADAEWIVSRSDLSKKFSDYEWGKFYFDKMQQTGMKQVELAELHKVSKPVMSRYINAYQVDPLLYSLFVDRSVINTKRDSERLIKLNKQIKQLDIDVMSFITQASELIAKKSVDCQDPDEHKVVVFEQLDKLLNQAMKQPAGKPKKVKPEPVKLYQGNDKQEFVSFVRNDERKATITLSRVPEDKQERINEMIAKFLAE